VRSRGAGCEVRVWASVVCEGTNTALSLTTDDCDCVRPSSIVQKEFLPKNGFQLTLSRVMLDRVLHDQRQR
jgi:hypothetical protein